MVRYWEQTDDEATLASAYETMQAVAEYIHRSQPEAGGNADLVTDLICGAGPYKSGIIHWPAPMR